MSELTVGLAARLYSEIVSLSSDAILLVDVDTMRCVEVNDAACAQFGYTREELLSMPVDELQVSVGPEEIGTRIALVLAEGGDELDAFLRTKQGEIRPIHVWARSVSFADRTLFHVVVRDVTERKHVDAMLRLQSAALFAAADAIMITDLTGAIEWVNPAFTDLTGYSIGEVYGRNPSEFAKSDQQPPSFYAEFWETILSGRTWHGTMVNRKRDGSLYTEDQSVTPIRDPRGNITHFVAIKSDISRRLRLESQLQQAQKMETVGQLASGIAHDFNNLLTVINGVVDLLLAQVPENNPMHADLLEIHDAGGRAAGLTRQLLAFSRKQVLQPRVLDLNDTVRTMETILRRVLGEHVVLTFNPSPDLYHVTADRGQLEQVLTNLTVNARDAMPGGGQLVVETRNITIDESSADWHDRAIDAGEYVELSVKDSGVGMEPAVQARIFDPFFTTKPPGEGTGLGLATAIGIIEQSRGFIRVESVLGEGTTFRVYLPRTLAPASVDAPEIAGDALNGSEKILVVEDNDGLRRLAKRLLEQAGYKVHCASSGNDALRVLATLKAPVDLLLTDLVMPGMSGRHLAEAATASYPGMRVLYMSGYTSDGVIRRGVIAAESAFLDKPFTAAALLAKVREVLGPVRA